MHDLLNTQVKNRGRIIAVGDGVDPQMSAPTWTPVQFEDSTFGVLGSWGAPLIFPFEEGGCVDYNYEIRHATNMPRVDSLATGWSTIRVDTADGRRLSIWLGWGFGKEDELIHRWEDPAEAEEAQT